MPNPEIGTSRLTSDIKANPLLFPQTASESATFVDPIWITFPEATPVPTVTPVPTQITSGSNQQGTSGVTDALPLNHSPYRIDRFFRIPQTEFTIRHEWGRNPIAIRTTTLDGRSLLLGWSIAPEQNGNEITFRAVAPITFFVSIQG